MSTFQGNISRGLYSARPAAVSTTVGALYYSTDVGITERNNGTTWDMFSSGGLLGYTSFGTATNTVVSTTSATWADMDATNLKVAFVVPSSGNVMVRLTAYADISVNTGQYGWALRSGSSNITGSGGTVARSADGLVVTLSFIVTGLTPGTATTWKWAHAVTGGLTGRILYGQGSSGTTIDTTTSFPRALMEVWAV